MALEVRRLVGHHRVADGVSLIEGVVGEVKDLIVNGLRRGLLDAIGDAAGDAPLRVAVDKGVPFLFDLLGLLLADGSAHHVRLPQREATQLLKNADDLLLIDDAAVGHRQDGDQLGVLVCHQLGIVLAGDKARDGLHGTRSVQRDDSGDILDVLGLQPHANTGHAGGLDLEHTGCPALRDHLVGLRVVVGDAVQRKVRLVPLHHLHRVVQYRQVPQPQKVHFQQPQLLQRGHDILAHHGVVVPCQRHIFVHRTLGDDHASRVGGGVAWHPLQRHGGVDELLHPWIVPVQIGQLLTELQRVLQRDMQRARPCRYQLGHHVHLGVGHIQGAAHIPDGSASRHGAEGNDLGHMVVAVLPANVVHHLTPSGVAEVHIDIGHGYPLRVEKTLEVQVVLHGVDVRDLQTVGHHGACGGAAPRPYRNVHALGVAHEVGHDEEVIGEPHLFDHVQLIVQLLAIVRPAAAVPLDKPLVTQLPQIRG